MAERMILVAIDENDCSEKAFDFYLDHIHRQNDHVLAVSVREPQPPFPVQDHSRDSESTRMKTEEDGIRRKFLGKKYKAKCKENSVNVTMCFEEGRNHGETICRVAKENGVAMIVMGSRGLGTVRRTILGSVSDYTMHHAEVPVLIVTNNKKAHFHEATH